MCNSPVVVYSKCRPLMIPIIQKRQEEMSIYDIPNMCAYCSYKFWKGSRRILRYLLHQNPTKYILGPLNKNLIEVNAGWSSSWGPRKHNSSIRQTEQCGADEPNKTHNNTTNCKSSMTFNQFPYRVSFRWKSSSTQRTRSNTP